MTDKEKIKKALDLVIQYGGIDGDVHRQWLIDQMVRVLATDYRAWVKRFENGEEGAHTYAWEEGIPP